MSIRRAGNTGISGGIKGIHNKVPSWGTKGTQGAVAHPGTSRFTSEGSKAMGVKLKKLEGQVKLAKAAVATQAQMMCQARFTPEGYKVAEAKLESLKKTETRLEAARTKLLDIMTRA